MLRFLLILAILLVGCDDEIEENGLIGNYYINWVPQYVDDHSSFDDFSILTEAVDWWNAQADRDGTDRTWFEISDIDDPDITAYQGETPVIDMDDWGLPIFASGVARIQNASDGLITHCEVVIADAYAYHRPTMVGATKHELGHCIGLDDDPASLDLNSIMSRVLIESGELTYHDFQLIVDMLDTI